MAIQVYIPTPFRSQTNDQSIVTLTAESVHELLEQLVRNYPGLHSHIFHSNGEVVEHLNIFVNEEEIRALQGTETPLKSGDEVALIPAMAGGQPTRPSPLLDEQQMERYSRHILLDEVGVQGQRKLLDSKVLLIGAGGLGSPAAVYLAAAGIGTLGIVDADVVDMSNLQRQILHFDRDVGRPKTQSARRHIEDLNPEVKVIEHQTLLTSENALEILSPYDLVINGCDNFPTRYLVSDACVLLGKPLVDASILKFEGQATVYLPGHGCYRCLFPSPPPPGSVPSCSEAGIVGALAGHMGTLQAVEAIKVLLDIGRPLVNRILIYDALEGTYRTLKWSKRPDCPACGDHPTITQLIDYEQFCGLPSRGEPEEKDGPSSEDKFSLDELSQNGHWDLKPEQVHQLLQQGEMQIFDVREPHEYRQSHIPGASLIPIGEFNDRLSEIPQDTLTVFVCRVGQISSMVVESLRGAGYQKAFNLEGGMAQWLNYRFPVESDEKE